MPGSSGASSWCIWMVACVLFISVVVGGGCLAWYVLHPESETAPWVPVVGVTLVCLPWLFWILTFLYRLVSRAFGFRMVLPNSNSGGGGANNNNNNNNNNGVQDGLSRSTSCASHESQMPLNASSTPS